MARLEQKIDVVPVDWCAAAIADITLNSRSLPSLMHLSADIQNSCRFAAIDAALAWHDDRPLGAYTMLAASKLDQLMSRIRERLPDCNAHPALVRRLFAAGLLLQQLVHAAAGIAPPPPLADYLGLCAASVPDEPVSQLMRGISSSRTRDTMSERTVRRAGTVDDVVRKPRRWREMFSHLIGGGVHLVLARMVAPLCRKVRGGTRCVDARRPRSQCLSRVSSRMGSAIVGMPGARRWGCVFCDGAGFAAMEKMQCEIVFTLLESPQCLTGGIISLRRLFFCTAFQVFFILNNVRARVCALHFARLMRVPCLGNESLWLTTLPKTGCFFPSCCRMKACNCISLRMVRTDIAKRRASSRT
ncbi:hypothetical protein [Herbaspirillum frisingense]|uniref:hypothetical protein n=1 Tax=Herbaspirillum frisingense TaxID=92645 RepID=UPI001F2431DE|nr:hypothetical protein [Herbaspirillum frisingense]